MIYLLKCPVGSVIILDQDFNYDLEWWISFLPKWNGTFSFLPINWLLPSVLHLYTDAAKGTGFGAFLNGHWFNGKWPLWVSEEKPSIAFLELIPIYLACFVRREEFSHNKIMFHSDNQSNCLAWENARTS